MNTLSRFSTCVVSLLTLTTAPLAVAGRPVGGGGGGTANGKIQYVAGDYLYSMNADGTAKQVASPALIQNALRAPLSAKKYGVGRWQLMLEPTLDVFDRYEDLNGNRQYDSETETLSTFNGIEVFAYRWNGIDWDVLQVTDTSRDGLREYHYAESDISLAWSNDGQDSFLSVRLTGSELDSSGRYLQTPARPQYIARIHVSGADLDLYANAGVDPKIRVSDSEFEIAAEDLTVTSESDQRAFSSHSWNPNGTKLVIGYSGVLGDPGALLFVWDVATGISQPLVHTESDLGVNHHWSPDGNKIVIGDSGDVLVVNPDGTGLNRLLSLTSANVYSFPYWSPDSKWILYRKQAATKSICKIPAAGGKEVNLTKDLNGISQFPLGWTAN